MIRKRTAVIGAIAIIIVTSMITFTFGNINALRAGDKVIISSRMFEQMQEESDGLNKLIYLKEFLLQEYYIELDENDLNFTDLC